MTIQGCSPYSVALFVLERAQAELILRSITKGTLPAVRLRAALDAPDVRTMAVHREREQRGRILGNAPPGRQPRQCRLQPRDAMRVIGQLFTILDVPAGPPRAAEGDADASGGGVGSLLRTTKTAPTRSPSSSAIQPRSHAASCVRIICAAIWRSPPARCVRCPPR